MKKKILMIIVSSVLVLAFASACAQQPVATQVPEEIEKTEAPASGETTEAIAAPVEVEKTKLIVWMAGDDARFMIDSDIPTKFETQYPQYDVEIVQLAWDAMHDKVIAGFSGGDLPDVFEGADQWVGEMADLGGLHPMDDFKSSNSYKDEDFFPTSWEHFRYVDGVLYAAPFQFESRMLFYRADILEEAGFSEPPKTLDELLTYAEALSNGNDKFAVTHQDQWLDFHFFSYLLYALEGDYYNADRTECTLTDPAGIEALAFYKKLYDVNAIPKDPAKRVDAWTGFKEGYYAMGESGGWWFGLLQSQAPELGKIGEGSWNVAPLPEGKTTVSYGHPNPWIIPAKAANIQGAYDWISFFYQQEIGIEWAMLYGQPPTVLSMYEDPQMANDPRMQALAEAARRGTNSIHNLRGADYVTQIVWNALADLRDDKSTPEEAAESVCTQMQEYLFEK